MILADTNIVPTFARVSALDCVRQVVRADRLHVTPATLGELQRAIEAGCEFLTATVAAIRSGTGFELVELRRDEILAVRDLPRSLGAGEAEAIAVCLKRPGTGLLTNDKRARNFCRQQQILCLDLPELLRAIWVTGVRPKEVVRELLSRIETEQGMVIKRKEDVFR